MRLLRLLLAVALVAGFVLGPGAVHAGAVVIVTTSGTAVAAMGPQTQDGRFNPDSAPSQCGAFDFSPTRTNQGTAFHYTNHTFRSSLTNSVCLTVTLTTSCTGSNEIFSVAYAGTFNPADPLENYAADIGSVVSASGSYSFAPPAGSPFSIVVHEVHSGGGCSPYSLSVTSDGPWADNRPAIVGNAPAIGAVITGNDATWKTDPAAPAVQRRWRRCDAAGTTCTDIPGATGTTYTPTDADLGHSLRFRNIATDADGTSTSDSLFVEPFIPFEAHDAESLGPGDRVHNGIFARDNVESRCGATKSAPTILQPVANFLYDPFPVRSLLNEQVCLVVRTLPGPGCGSGVTPAIYAPAFAPPAGIATNYAANSGLPFNSAAMASAILQPGGARDVTVSIGSSASVCAAYNATLGADAPFAGARPALSGSPVEGGTLTATDGTWSGAPVLARSWVRCDDAGASCEPIPGATGASYAPTRADVGRRLRARVTATQGRSVSSDSEPSDVIAPDTTPPSGTIRLASLNLKKAVRVGFVPIAVTCSEACSALVDLRVSKRTARRLGLKKKTRIARGTGAVQPGKTTRLRAKLTRAARRALKKRKSVKLTVAAALTDSARNTAHLTRRGTLKRPRR